jgi:polyhydroxyalkanoate synthase subunit PhaC
MKFDLESSIEALETLNDDIYNRCKTEFYRGTVRVFNAMRLLTSRGYLTRFEGTPSEVVMAERHFTLKRFWQDYYSSPYVPVLMIPPLMVTPQIYDLRPRHSFVRHLLNYDFDVFLVDFGAPTKRDREIKLGDYVRNIGKAINRIQEITGSPRVNLLGYCMGGIFSHIYTPLDEQDTVQNIVSIGTPADFSRLPKYHSMAQYLDGPLLALADMLDGVPAPVSRGVFQMMQPLKNLALPMNLMINLWDEDYVAAYESMERWFDDFVTYPRDAFKQFFIEVVKKNKLYRSELKINGEKVELSKIKVPYLSLAGREDFLGHPLCVKPILDVIGSKDKMFQEVSGGHLGVLAGKSATHAWNLIAQWLIPRSKLKSSSIKAITPASNGHKNGHKPPSRKLKLQKA